MSVPAGHDDDRRALDLVCELAARAAGDGGGPFAALVLHDGAELGRGTNRVTHDLDPTAHAEVVALRAAARARGSFDLSGATLYASCQPCPMCLAAAWWARVGRILYAATTADAAAAGFDDLAFHEALAGRTPMPVAPRHVPVPAAALPFATWAANPRRVEY
ncbi:MAG: nucleoside deaminase [Acidimicrobiia bacterium]